MVGSPGPARPNFVVILADDLGFSDLGCYGAEIRTPHLDRMAREGARFSQFYNCARCCPTRASLLTGLYPHQAGVGFMVQDRGISPAYQGYLRADTVTMGEALQAAGYRTGYIGKWHVSPGLPVAGDGAAALGSARNPYPRSRGFERFYGTLAGCGNYFNPHGLMDDDRRIHAADPDYYLTDALTDEAVRFVGRVAGGEQPFLLHLCYTAPHWPLHARPADIDAYRGRYRAGWDATRAARHESARALGLLDSRWPISPRDAAAPAFGSLSPRRQEWEDLRMAVYAAQVEAMDRGIGRVVAALEAAGALDQTAILFLSDNGGCAELLREDGGGPHHPGFYRHTARPGEVCRVGNIEGLEPGPATTFMSYDLPWANVSSAPFRLYKHWVHEGGIATPGVLRWPGVARPGSVVERPSHVIDVLPTLLEAARAAAPTERLGCPVPPAEGESLLPALVGGATGRAQPLFWEHEGNGAVRDGPWKLVRRHGAPWELYRMDEDRTELDDRAAREPVVRERLVGLYESWADRCGVLPWPLPPPRG